MVPLPQQRDLRLLLSAQDGLAVHALCITDGVWTIRKSFSGHSKRCMEVKNERLDPSQGEQQHLRKCEYLEATCRNWQWTQCGEDGQPRTWQEEAVSRSALQ